VPVQLAGFEETSMPGPVRELARTLLSFAVTRARLAAAELEEQALRLTEILIWLLVALFFLGVATVFGAVLVVLLFWDSNRVLAAGLLAALFVSIGIGAALIARVRMTERPKLLAATLTELERDRDTLGRP
jgi:uncharacterized membrane protein YqjE